MPPPRAYFMQTKAIHILWQGYPRYQGDLDLLIQRAEAERLQTLSELQPVFHHWQGIKVRLTSVCRYEPGTAWLLGRMR